jgi:hypothetical protein
MATCEVQTRLPGRDLRGLRQQKSFPLYGCTLVRNSQQCNFVSDDDAPSMSIGGSALSVGSVVPSRTIKAGDVAFFLLSLNISNPLVINSFLYSITKTVANRAKAQGVSVFLHSSPCQGLRCCRRGGTVINSHTLLHILMNDKSIIMCLLKHSEAQRTMNHDTCTVCCNRYT